MARNVDKEAHTGQPLFFIPAMPTDSIDIYNIVYLYQKPWHCIWITSWLEAKTCWTHFPHTIPFLLLRCPTIPLGFTILGEMFAYVTIFNATIKVVTFCLRGWLVHAGCVFVGAMHPLVHAGCVFVGAMHPLEHARCVFVVDMHPSRTWMSGSFEPMQWNACEHRLDLGSYSHPKEFWGNGVRTHVNSNTASSRTAGPNYLPTSYPGPSTQFSSDQEEMLVGFLWWTLAQWNNFTSCLGISGASLRFPLFLSTSFLFLPSIVLRFYSLCLISSFICICFWINPLQRVPKAGADFLNSDLRVTYAKKKIH